MLNTKDILETINMIKEENLDIRTVTMGISLFDCISDDQKKLEKKVYAVSEKVYKAAAEAQQAAGQNGNAAGGADNVYDADFTDVDDTKK